jgi:2-dehydro-3-deoxyphosphogluconate aldolase/(4S)-4-hydroxy-2-oxoglutarate aldolase
MTKSVRARIQDIGIIPGVRVSVPDDARFAAEAVCRAGIPIAEITMTTPHAIDVISHLAKKLPDMVVGAGTVLDKEVVVFPGALTPAEVIKVPLPQVPLIASGGVNQVSAVNFILAGATALGIGNELLPHEAVHRRREEHIQELAHRFINMVKDARAQHVELRGRQ